MKKNNDTKDYPVLRTIGISEQWTLLCEQKKLLTSRQIVRYAVPARTVGKKSTASYQVLHWYKYIIAFKNWWMLSQGWQGTWFKICMCERIANHLLVVR